MRRFFYVLGLAVLAFVPVRAALPATDSFQDRTASTLGSNWTAIGGAALTAWSVVTSVGATTTYGGADFAAAYWSADTFGNDQYAQVAITKGAAGYEGVGVRFSAGPNGYFADLESNCTIYKWVSGTRSTLTTCSTITWTSGDVLKISVSGTTITVYQNGTSRGSTTDSSITTGSAGVMGYTDAGQLFSLWQGDNVGGAAAVPVVNVPIIIRRPGAR